MPDAIDHVGQNQETRCLSRDMSNGRSRSRCCFPGRVLPPSSYLCSMGLCQESNSPGMCWRSLLWGIDLDAPFDLGRFERPLCVWSFSIAAGFSATLVRSLYWWNMWAVKCAPVFNAALTSHHHPPFLHSQSLQPGAVAE